MNRIYRKIWNKALGRIVVASELASSDGGGATVGAVGTQRGGGIGIDRTIGRNDDTISAGTGYRDQALADFLGNQRRFTLQRVAPATTTPGVEQHNGLRAGSDLRIEINGDGAGDGVAAESAGRRSGNRSAAAVQSRQYLDADGRAAGNIAARVVPFG